MNWQTYLKQTVRYSELEFSIDFSRSDLTAEYEAKMASAIDRAFEDMRGLEAGEVANPDEGRMVGHYWLRNAQLAPTAELRAQVTEPVEDLKQFAKSVHSGELTAPDGSKFTQLLLIGIGGSALGPQLVDQALAREPALDIHFFDNTDPDGMDRTLAKLDGKLNETLALVVSKSGGTAETRNGMLEAKAAYEAAGLDFGGHTVAVTGEGSKLDQYATEKGFFKRFPMEDWVGGRTSVMSVVGLVPAALQGIDIDEFLSGAADMDQRTREARVDRNAAMKLALAWHAATNGRGEKDMVILPYKDSLVLFSKYLQQLVMESLGKEHDLDGEVVHQGIAVYGNKGSTDQHAYVQQLRDGVANFFATFIEVRKGREGSSIEVEPGATSADFLQGFLRGTRKALFESGRKSITISIGEVTPHSLGALIALYERAVSFYASLVNINAYHQPGVEAGKKAAGEVLKLISEVKAELGKELISSEAVAQSLGADPEEVYHCLVHLGANDPQIEHQLGENPAADLFRQV